MLLLKTVILFYINAILTPLTVIPTHILSVLVEIPTISIPTLSLTEQNTLKNMKRIQLHC